jgi:hypothetical protein
LAHVERVVRANMFKHTIVGIFEIVRRWYKGTVVILRVGLVGRLVNTGLVSRQGLGKTGSPVRVQKTRLPLLEVTRLVNG